MSFWSHKIQNNEKLLKCDKWLNELIVLNLFSYAMWMIMNAIYHAYIMPVLF